MKKHTSYHIPPAIEVEVKRELEGLLDSKSDPVIYRQHMTNLGRFLASTFVDKLSESNKVLLISTAEDADYLLSGVKNQLDTKGIQQKLAIFWNHHHSLNSNGKSVAPILHRFIEDGYRDTDTVVIVKSVISGSCVVRTNLIAMLEQVRLVNRIYIVSPVMHIAAEENLEKEFPDEISSKFRFVYFAKDEEKSKSGEVIPGIGGQIYELLGLGDQPVLTGYIPKLVQLKAFP